MRYYDIQILEADGSQFARYTSFVNGATDPGALQVDMDIPVTLMAVPLGAASVKIWGVSLQTIGQASDFNGKFMKVFAGMKPGLPLAKPGQAGLVLQGSINQAFGNWIGVNQWVEFVVVTDGAALADQPNITFSWPRGTSFPDAVTQAVQTASPGYTVTVDVADNLVNTQDEVGYYQTMTQFAQYLKTMTAGLLGGDYLGVDILISESAFRVTDGTTPASPLQLDFNDLVGQPTWIDPATIQVTVVMRADLQPTDYVRLPPSQVTTTPGSLSQFRDKSVFQGAFMVREMRHIGSSRQPDALAWVTVLNCSPTTAAA